MTHDSSGILNNRIRKLCMCSPRLRIISLLPPGNASVVLKNGESATIQQITSGDVRIKEESGDYWASVTVNGADERYNQENGILLNIDNTNVTAAFTNQMEQQPVTGITMMTFPYVLILCIAVLALGYGYARRKRNV